MFCIHPLLTLFCNTHENTQFPFDVACTFRIMALRGEDLRGHQVQASQTGMPTGPRQKKGVSAQPQ
jgi:hypothetical protein